MFCLVFHLDFGVVTFKLKGGQFYKALNTQGIETNLNTSTINNASSHTNTFKASCHYGWTSYLENDQKLLLFFISTLFGSVFWYTIQLCEASNKTLIIKRIFAGVIWQTSYTLAHWRNTNKYHPSLFIFSQSINQGLVLSELYL